MVSISLSFRTDLTTWSTINSENGQFCKAHRWRLKGFLCSVCCLKHWSLTCQIKKKNIWKTLGIFTLPLCDLLTLRTPSVKWPFRIWPLQLWGFLLCCCGKSDIKCHRRLSKKKKHMASEKPLFGGPCGLGSLPYPSLPTRNCSGLGGIGVRGLFRSAVNLSVVCANVKCQHFIVLTSNLLVIVNL